MPDSLRFLIILGVIGSIIYAGAWWLANFPPQPTQVEKSISSSRLRG